MKTEIFPHTVTTEGSLYKDGYLVNHNVTVIDNGLTIIIGSIEHQLKNIDWDAENKIIEPHMDDDRVSPWHVAY